MDYELEWIKEIPIEQIRKFEDKIIYNCAVYTREFTKSQDAYPYLSGELQKSEVALPIQTINENEYGLGAGIDYAVKVWKYKNANWTNPSTQPQWYYTIYRNNNATIMQQAFSSALKEV